jgi:spectinomycin phosphotransferase
LFVTVDDLEQKKYLGQTPDAAFEGLRSAFDAALALRVAGGEFVVAPLQTLRGETVRRVNSNYSVAVFPFVEGSSRPFHESPTSEERDDLVRTLVRLHQATPLVTSIARPISIQLPGRAGLESALQELNVEWMGGPFSEPARALVLGNLDGLRRLLDTFDNFSDQVVTAGLPPVITHGEPHPGNVLNTADGLVLVDWDTAGLAAPERDIWMVDSGTGHELALYADASGRHLDMNTIAAYRVRWKLDDIATFVKQFRSPHDQTADTELAWVSLGKSLQSGDDSRFHSG